VKLVITRGVVDQLGLRERKKQRTRETISNAAISLFLASGFDQVSVAEVAEASEVSKRTLFAYFPTKEDLVVHRFADHETVSGRVVLEREAGQPPLTALLEYHLDGLSRRDPLTGLNDRPEMLALFGMVVNTPALVGRMLRSNAGAERALAEALVQTTGVTRLVARLAAAQMVTVLWTLAVHNVALLASGATADDRYPDAVAAAEQGFAMLHSGLDFGAFPG
jgi:AcrR family transcriptional regulator